VRERNTASTLPIQNHGQRTLRIVLAGSSGRANRQPPDTNASGTSGA
jgi:hypothetical protein